jgi:hypothetical protein
VKLLHSILPILYKEPLVFSCSIYYAFLLILTLSQSPEFYLKYYAENKHHITNIMVSLDVVRSTNAALVKSQPLVGVFVGSTSGIGLYAVKALARHAKDGPGLRLYIVGRNEKVASGIITECQQICPTGQFHFVKAKNLALMKDVDRVCEEIIGAERKEVGEKAKIDLLVMTHAYLAFEARRGETFPPQKTPTL